MSRKYLRIVINEDKAEEFRNRKKWVEKETGVKMTDSSFASSLIKIRLEDQPQEVKMVFILDFMRKLIGDDDIDINTRRRAVDIILAITHDLPIDPP